MKQITANYASDLLSYKLTRDNCVIANVPTFGGARSRPMNVNRDNCDVKLWMFSLVRGRISSSHAVDVQAPSQFFHMRKS